MSRFSLIFLGASLLVVMLVLVSGPEQVEAGKSKKQLLAFALLSLLNRGKKIVVPIPLPLPVPVVDKKKHYVTKESIPMPLPVYSHLPPVYHNLKMEGGYGGKAGVSTYNDATGDAPSGFGGYGNGDMYNSGGYGGGSKNYASDEYGGQSSVGDSSY